MKLITFTALKLSPWRQVSYVVDVITLVTMAVLVAGADLTEVRTSPSARYKDSDALGVFEGATLSHECGFWVTGHRIRGTARRDVGVAQV